MIRNRLLQKGLFLFEDPLVSSPPKYTGTPPNQRYLPLGTVLGAWRASDRRCPEAPTMSCVARVARDESTTTGGEG